MLLESKNAGLLVEHAGHVTSLAVKDALAYLVGVAALDGQLQCHAELKGAIRDFRFHDANGRLPFSLIVNRESLLFYLRAPAMQSGSYTPAELQSRFSDVRENNSGEWTVKIHDLDDARRLWAYINGASEFHSGDGPTTQVGYINRNRQRCGGHRGLPGNDHLQKAYRMECLKEGCGNIYGANGSDVHLRKCPSCQGGEPGIDF